MKALRYYTSVPRYLLAGRLGKRYPVPWLPLKLEELQPPEPPPGWRRVAVRLAGICGSDLALLFGNNSPRLSPFFSFPAVLGHEVVGEVEGVRVAINPLIACRERGFAPCPACQRGEDNACLNLTRGAFAPGFIGYCRDLPGGWGETLIAHQDRLIPIANGIPDERAVLLEPLAVVRRGLRLAFPGWPHNLLVIGMGSIGLLTIKVLRLLGFAGELHAVARYPAQAAMARQLGASQVHGATAEAAGVVGASRHPALIGPPAWRGGFEAVIDAAGSSASLDEAAWATREGGTLLLLGAPGNLRHDFSPYWFREVRLVGSFAGAPQDFSEATALLPDAKGLEAIVTHRFALSAWPQALGTLRSRRALKVVFDPRLS
ncbi:MAG: zinc-binding dehydrogenase [Truepera sp.]|nr:zinc-binding dehydrogenase [Truepera sp.]